MVTAKSSSNLIIENLKYMLLKPHINICQAKIFSGEAVYTKMSF